MNDYISARYEQFIEDLETIANIDSGSHDTQGIEKIVAFFQERFSRLGWHTRTHYLDEGRVPCLEAANVDPQEAETTLDFLCLGHMDTVFLKGEAKERPFSIDGNIARGPGVCDMKGGLVAVLHVMETLKQFGIADRLSLCVGFNSDEEIGSRASREWFEPFAKKSKRAFIFEPGRIGGQRVLQRKGGGWYGVECYGKAAHAGVEPEKGVNAVVELAHQILKITRFADSEKGTSVNVTVTRGGAKNNVIPDFARAGVDVRVSDAAEIKRIGESFDRLARTTHVEGVRVEVQGGINRPPMAPSEKTLRLWEQIKAIGNGLGQDMELIATGGGSDGNFTSAMGVPTIDAMGPRGGRAHSKDEFLDLDSVIPTVRLVCEIFKAGAEGKLL